MILIRCFQAHIEHAFIEFLRKISSKHQHIYQLLQQCHSLILCTSLTDDCAGRPCDSEKLCRPNTSTFNCECNQGYRFTSTLECKGQYVKHNKSMFHLNYGHGIVTTLLYNLSVLSGIFIQRKRPYVYTFIMHN